MPPPGSDRGTRCRPGADFPRDRNPLFHLGARPVLADVDSRGQLDLTDAARRITDRTKAVVAVHLWGLPEDMDALVSFADEHGLMLLEDGSHAHGATWNGQRTGTFGAASAFSLNGPRPLSAGEGGRVMRTVQLLRYLSDAPLRLPGGGR
ncbi:DegT/DnrJ/EryC1/StrS family aminotransferase [Streptomyces sp. A1-5]|uniref:DegT/DnrJ/EryC1/StrS family aminotransferase n=1 Tax=Streptomyces sp. A1-5 TaxID=2738410 RepID=UPI0022865319|nr:DegT/DnrJ/EryC1/StrS family aminotransferase [Streptomyces sp. A1-5]